MSDLEYDVLDELYFVLSFEQLAKRTDLEDDELKKVLRKMLAKKWIKCFQSATEEIPDEDVDFDNNARRYFYLATKSGLMAHNSTD